MKQTLILIRGLPGSGKSTLATLICEGTLQDVFDEEPPYHRQHEADDYFLVKGEYKFEAAKLKEAHETCRLLTRETLRQGHSAVVSNTFTQLWEMQPYFDMAKEFNIPVQVIECKGNFGSIHNVPEEKLEQMRQRWEEYK